MQENSFLNEVVSTILLKLFCTVFEKDRGSTLQTILAHLRNYDFNLQSCRGMSIYINTPSCAVILFFSPHSKRFTELHGTNSY